MKVSGMKKLAATVTLCLFMASSAFAEHPQYRYMIPSWGDVTLVHGPGTDPAMDSQEAFDRLFAYWKARGFTGVFLRTDLVHMLPGSIVQHPRDERGNPTLAVFWHIVDEIMEKCDPQVAARIAGEKAGFDYWMSHPHIYSEGAPADAGVDGPGRMVPWSYMRKYHQDYPEVITIDREGNRLEMVPEYAYPGARKDKVDEFVFMAKTFKPTGIIASMRSEASQLIPPPDHGDQYGFNQPVVDDMKRLYNVDIMTDPRFDYKSASFKLDDPMVENWRVLRGSYLTQLYREISQAMRKEAPGVQLAITLSGEYAGPVLGNWKTDWRTWIDEGIVDVIIVPVTFEATLDLDAAKKSYLTHNREGVGTVSTQEIHEYIAKSKHPRIKVIQTGAPSYFYPPVPEGADAWQCDAWYDLYTLAWYQRWEQWKKDLKDLGHVNFFQQDFDGFPVASKGESGGMGDGRYHPELRAAPGVWYTFGDGSDDKPVVQDKIHRGDSGNAVLVTVKELSARHHSGPDRSQMTSHLDNAIVNGKARLSTWLYRENDDSSIAVHLTSDTKYEKDVGVRIEPKTGKVSYANGNEWVATDIVFPVKQWQEVVIDLDADATTYSASTGEGTAICSGIKYAPPTERFVEQHGVNVPIKVPSYRIFNFIHHIPLGMPDSRVYVDDVLVTWQPTLFYTEPGSKVLLSDNFEEAKPGAKTAALKSDAKWRVEPANAATAYWVENTTSYGEGVNCIRTSGGGKLTAAVPTKGQVSTLDLDLFIRSDKDFPYMMPDPTTRSPHSVVVALQGDAAGQPLVAVDTSGSTWKLWDGDKFVDTGKFVTYDVWSHLQIAIDPVAGTYQLVTQPIGELPTVIGTAKLGSSVKPADKLNVLIAPSATDGHISCYDNLVITGN
jgi:hypothetical protein